jgi:carboxyl-terminal processing protease
LSSRALRVVAFAAVFFAAGAIIGARVEPVRDRVNDIVAGDEDVSSEALELIEENYFHEIDADELERSSVRGIIGELKRRYKDRFSHYFDPEAFEQFESVTEGSFSGVGLSVTEVPRGLRVARVFANSPAQEAGIRRGEVVTEVNGESIAGEDAEVATSQIKGRPGTTVTISVLAPGSGAPREVELTRRNLRVPAVEGKLKEVNGVPVAHVQLLEFSHDAHQELRDEIERLDEMGAEGLVLDLRGNGGGLLTEAVLTSSVFVEDGVIVSTEGRTTGEESFEAVGDALPERPMVVLINGDTASASEILAAAVSEAGLATVVGEASFGKGTFQQVIPLNGGEDGALDLTIGEYVTRDGTSINGVGIEPEVPARDKIRTKQDEGLEQALQALGNEL